MKILLASHLFYPSTGGIQIMSAALATEFVRQGHEVRVVTQTPNPEPDSFPFEVVRRPGPKQLLALARWCDVFFHNNISLQTVWPLCLVRRPWVVAHRTWIARNDGSLGWQDRAKRFLSRYATGISISRAVADSLPTPSTVIGNFYRDDLFRILPDGARDGELVFVGRLVSDKGVDTLLEAMSLLKQHELAPKLTVIGDGPEADNLQKMAAELEIGPQVSFVGSKTGPELVRLLNAHRIIVVPSRWKEPFGIVALEGLACGCVAVVSAGGGLGDAVGPAGVTFPNGDAPALSEALCALLTDPAKMESYRRAAVSHLENHRQDRVAAAYLDVFERARAA